MKILIAAGIFPPDIGGPALYAKEIAGQFNNQGIRTDVVCYANEKIKDNYNFKVFKVLRKHSLIIRYFLYFLEILSIARKYDLIYAQGPVGSGFPSSKVAKLLNKKFVVKVTGDYAWEQARNSGVYIGSIEDFQKLKFQGKIGKLQKIERKTCNSADFVIVPSQYLRKIVATWGVDNAKIKVIYNAVKKNPFISSKDRDNNLILSIGRLVSWKGFDVLIGLMPELLKINPDFKLVILGSGPEQDNLNNLINKLGLQEKVFISHQSHESVLDYLVRAGIFVLNTDYEGLSHTILEAMQAGTPVAASNIGGNPELIQDNYNGFLFEYNNKEQIKNVILKIYQNSAIKERFNTNSKKVSKKFVFNKMIQDTLIFLRELCGS
ncbi:MAG: glycosyltransferase family 4 protein [bacterium]